LLLYDFLKHLQQSKTEELNKIQHELQMVNEDFKQIEESLNLLKVILITCMNSILHIINHFYLIKTQPDLLNTNKSSDNQKSNEINSQTLTTEPNENEESSIPPAPSSPSILIKSESDSTQNAAATSSISQDALSSAPNKLQSVLSSKKRIIHRYFDELSQAYVQCHNRDLKDFSIKGKKKIFF